MNETDIAALSLEPMGRLLGFLADEGASLCQQVFGKDSCIASTNVALKVLDYFDVGGYAKQVKADVWRLDGSYGVGIAGTGTHTSEKWDGHLVAVVPLGDAQFLLDMTCGQLSRPERSLLVPDAALLELPDEWDSFSVEGGVAVYTNGAEDNPEAIAIRYQVIDADESGWRGSGDWTDPYNGIKKIAALIVRAFKEKERGNDFEWDIDIEWDERHRPVSVNRLDIRVA